MSLSAAEKLEVIRMVEESELPVKRTLAELGVSRSSFYRWYQYYLDDGPASPAYILMQAGDSFQNPTRRVNELWQTDFTYFRVVGWGWYYLSTVLDNYSRYIITPADMYVGRYQEIMDRRAIIKYETLQRRRNENLRHCVNQ